MSLMVRTEVFAQDMFTEREIEVYRVLAYSPESDSDFASVTFTRASCGLQCSACGGAGCHDCIVDEAILAEGDDSVERWAVEHSRGSWEPHELESARVVLDALVRADTERPAAQEGAAA